VALRRLARVQRRAKATGETENCSRSLNALIPDLFSLDRLNRKQKYLIWLYLPHIAYKILGLFAAIEDHPVIKLSRPSLFTFPNDLRHPLSSVELI
jgi:hypothetical protein